MATSSVTSSGLGSGLDVDSIVSKLVAADRSATDTRLDATELKTNVQISALGSMKSSMSSLGTVLTSLNVSGLGKRTATVSDSSLLTATASNTAQPGSTQIEVLSLAKAHKIGSGSFASSSAVVGEGSFTIGVGSQSFSVNLSSTTTVAGLRDAINNASDNKGVTATLVQEDGGVRLVLTSKNTGTASALSVTSTATSFSDLQAASDAQIKVDGYTRTSSYNTIVGVVDGVNIDLLKAQVGTTTTITVAADQKAATDAITSFVDAYNSLLSTYKSLTAYDAATSSGGALMGDASTRAAMQALRSGLSSSVDSGTYQMLSQIGISTQLDGTLKIDSDKLSAALSADSASVQKLFNGTGGIATQLSATLKNYAGDDGQFDTKLDALNKQLQKVDDDRDALDLRMEKAETRYRAQFSSLDSIVSKYNNVASYLDQMDNERYKLKS